MPEDPIVIVDYARTPMGGFQGVLQHKSAVQLGSEAIRAALERASVQPDEVDEVFMGCVLAAGLGQAPARQAALAAGLPHSVGCTTVNKMCGSGMKALMLAHDLIRAGSGAIMVAGGMESMSNAPYLLPKARGGLRLGHSQLWDHMLLDGLEDAYEKGRLMGCFAEDCAKQYGFTRQAQDQYAIESLTRAQRAIQDGTFASEITPVPSADENPIEHDEQPLKANREKIPLLKPVFLANGTVTAANASSISDGAAALVLMPLSEAEKRGLTPLAKILAHAGHSQESRWFTTAPVGAIKKLLAKIQLTISAIDLFEINEAFAVVTLAAMRELAIPHEKLNVHGGACALGHPIGASGARILVTLLSALEKYDLRLGVASLCIGGGEATAMAVERLH